VTTLSDHLMNKKAAYLKCRKNHARHTIIEEPLA
jgi:hypothetical protein